MAKQMSGKSKQREGDQILPVGGETCIQDVVIDQMIESKRVGTERYGSPLMSFNSRRSIQDAQEEARDLMVYLTQVTVEAEATRDELVQIVAQKFAPRYESAGGLTEVVRKALAETAVDAVMGWVVGQRQRSDGGLRDLLRKRREEVVASSGLRMDVIHVDEILSAEIDEIGDF